jgi:hypothetical protein
MQIALEGHAGAGHLGQAEDIVGFQAQSPLDFRAHNAPSRASAPEETPLEADIRRP